MIGEIQKIVETIKKIVPKTLKVIKRGRSKKYENAEIITGAIVLERYKLSLRKLEEIMKESEGIEADHTTYYRRIKKLEPKMLKEIISIISKKIERKVVKEELIEIVDGSGIGYRDKVKIRYRIGEEIKEINNHIKIVSVIKVVRDKKGKEQGVIEEIEEGEGYSDEGKLFKKIIERGRLREGRIIGDGYYGIRKEIIRMLNIRGIKLISPVRESMYKKIRSKEIKEVKERYENSKEIYRKRYKIEQVFGIIKRRYGSIINTKNKEIATNRTLIKFLAYNLHLLIFNFYLKLWLINSLKFNLYLSLL